MKKKIGSVLVILLLVTVSTPSLAQKKRDYIPEKGFWQLVSNTHDKKNIMVQFYNDDRVLMYQERVHARLNVNRKKTRHQLYDALHEAYNIWSLTHASPEAKNLIAKRR